MTKKISLGFLAITGALIGAETIPAWAAIVHTEPVGLQYTPIDRGLDRQTSRQPIVANDDLNVTKDPQLSVGNIPNLPSVNSLGRSTNLGENKFQSLNSNPKIDLNLDANRSDLRSVKLVNDRLIRQNLFASTAVKNQLVNQINVFSSDVASLDNKLSANVTDDRSERSIPIFVPLPRTQSTPIVIKNQNGSSLEPGSPTINPSSSPTGSIDSGANQPSIELVYPLLTPAPIASRFGWRTHPLTGMRRFHSGVDMAAQMGAPVVAAGSGTIVSAGWKTGYGNTIVIQHNGTQQTLYGHLSKISVQAGQSIARGTVIGLVGSTGNSTGPHLHFESRMLTATGWSAIDPREEIQYALENLKRSAPFANRESPLGI
jgi:murein DD-endopeptidase MepM/ murein hydrolase activator NlpD